MPDFTGIVTVAAHRLINLIVQTFGTELAQLVVEAQRQATRFRIGKVVAANAGVKPFHTVEDQAIHRVAGGKRQAAEHVVIESGKSIGMIFHLVRAGQHRKGVFRMLTESGTNKDRRDVGANGEQIINELRHAFMVKTRQRFKNVQPGRFPEVVHFRRLTVLDRQPAIARQPLKHFTQRGASDANQFREFAFSRKNGPRRETIIPDAFNDVLFRETRRALRLNDHSEISITQL